MVSAVALSEGFFHWELEFAPVFQRGGFDLQLGNPPWVRPSWLDDLVLAEIDPWFGLAGTTNREFGTRRSSLLAHQNHKAAYVSELTRSTSSNALLAAANLRPELVGAPLNLYTVFVVDAWRHMNSSGVAGLLHPPGYLFESKTGRLRRQAYPRLRRAWHFVNQAPLFPEIGGTIDFGIHIYSAPREIKFPLLTGAQLPDTIDSSIDHDGSGPVPGIKTDDARWDRRPHKQRIVWIDHDVLADFARLYDELGTPTEEARLVRPYTRLDVEALRTVSSVDVRIASTSYRWSRGWEEDRAKVAGLIEWRTEFPPAWSEVIYQGPHFTSCNPFAKQPNENCRSKGDWSRHELRALPSDAIPRTNYQRACEKFRYQQEMPVWNGHPASDQYRIIYRRMAAAETERSLQAALIPPGPLHVNTCHTMALPSLHETVVTVGLWSSICLDFVFKTSGRSDVQDDVVQRFPFPHPSPFDPAILLRALRLNCLTSAYSEAWTQLIPNIPTHVGGWASTDTRLTRLDRLNLRWDSAVPLRSELDRRQALVELDALGALAVGLSADQLCALYRSTFGRLRQFEHVMRHDQNGREVPKAIWTAYEDDPSGTDLSQFVPPFTKPEREAEMRQAYAVFAERYGGGAA